MKSILILFVFVILSLELQAQKDYYWYQGQKVSLEKIPRKKYLLLESITDSLELKNTLHASNIRVSKFDKTHILPNLHLYGKTLKKERKWAIIESPQIDSLSLVSNNNILYESGFFYTSDKKEVGLSHLFYVKLKGLDDLTELEKLANEFKVEILGSNKFMPSWYTLSCSKESSGDALAMANLFYETNLFAASEPDLMSDDLPTCVNDFYFDNQWGLDNTGQHNGTSGIDINMCQTWQSTMGSADVIVAVVDQGIQLNHPDMTNIYNQSFDTETGTSPSQVLGDHGTACAGIIGANSNNNLGVSGIAPDCPLMSISNSFSATPNSRQKRANGINFAWQHGASVISNSWTSGVQYQIIDDAIASALTYGRNGLGCVVVFASGNDNSSVSYPANSNPEIIAVGAISPCGERKSYTSCDGETGWGSNYGNKLDVAAPGVLIPTTDRTGNDGYSNGDYTMSFNGTSSACPHVSATAALMLSVNPCLTQKDVSDIIESTAQKVGGYNYQTVTGRPNGTWFNQLGYGLLDANAAVNAAMNHKVLTLSNIIYEQDATIDGCNDVKISNVEVHNGARLEVSANNVYITANFVSQAGTELYIH